MMTEYLGFYLRDVVRDYPLNKFIYNIYYLIHFTFFFYIFMKMIENDRFKKKIKIALILFWLFFLGDIIFTGIFKDAFIITYIAGACILIFCIILYYISILQSSLVLVIKNDLLFWVSVGLFLFYIGYIPIKIIRSWFYESNDLSFFNILMVIQSSLIIVMYLCFLIGFLWMKKRS